MATAPVRVSYHVQATTPFLSTGTPKTCTGVTFQVGDYLEVKASAEQHGTSATVTPTLSAGAATWTKYADQGAAGANNSGTWSWVGVVTTAASNVTVTLARPTGSNVQWGFTVSVIRGATGIGVRFEGNNGTSSTAPSVTQTVAANSLLTCQINDWNATDGTSRTWRTVNGSPITEASYYRSASTHTIYGGYVADSGAGGSVTMGLTAPATQRWVMSGFEFLGSSGSSPVTYAASGLAAASTTAVGAATAILLAAGAVSGVSALSGSATIAPRLQAAAGVVAGASTVTGSATRVSQVYAASGVVGSSSDVTGAATRVLRTFAAEGTVAGSSTAVGTVTSRLPASGAVGSTAAVIGSTTSRLPTSGAVAATSAASGAVSVVGGPVTHSGSGAVAVVSTVAGQVTARLRSAGAIPASSTVTGSASLVSAPVVSSAAGTIAATTDLAGTVTYVARASGQVAASSEATGSAQMFGPDAYSDLDVTATLAPRPTVARLAFRPTTVTLGAPAARATASLGNRRTTATLEEQ